MLVIISDLHLTDGTSGETIRENAFIVLRQRLRNLAYDASWREDGGAGRYEPIQKMTVVLLGDILDVIRSRSWLTAGTERPWSDPQAPGFIDRVRDINAGILEQSRASLEIVKSLSQGGITLSGGRQGEEESPLPRVTVEVETYYLVGNHDWFYHLPGAAYDEIRATVVEAMGLANDPREPFPHDPGEPTRTAAALRAIYQDHRVFARHGDIYDPFNYEQEHGRDHSSLGDTIVVQLLNRFAFEIEKDLGKQLPPETVLGFRELDNVKPYLVIPGWINGLLDRTVLDEGLRKRVKQVWNDLAADFLRLDFVRKHDRPWRWDLVDTLQAGLKIGSGFSLEEIGKLALKYYRKSGSGEASYSGNVLQETPYRKGLADFFVYGHTHDYEVVPLTMRRDLQQLYVNSGTWRRVYRLVKHRPESLEFYGYNVMTYLAFFRGTERRGRRFETWSGTLGL